MRPYGASELMRNKEMQKMLDSLSTKIRPNKKYITDRKDLDGGAIDIHKLTGNLPRPKGGWTPSDYKYLGPYNPFDKRLKYETNSGQVLEWYVQLKNKVDEIAAYHDICYLLIFHIQK